MQKRVSTQKGYEKKLHAEGSQVCGTWACTILALLLSSVLIGIGLVAWVIQSDSITAVALWPHGAMAGVVILLLVTVCGALRLCCFGGKSTYQEVCGLCAAAPKKDQAPKPVPEKKYVPDWFLTQNSKGDYYYYNRRTREFSWVEPPELREAEFEKEGQRQPGTRA